MTRLDTPRRVWAYWGAAGPSFFSGSSPPTGGGPSHEGPPSPPLSPSACDVLLRRPGAAPQALEVVEGALAGQEDVGDHRVEVETRPGGVAQARHVERADAV